MTELVLFLLVGGLALASAVAMLLSDNAVHSALFLITTMGCIAFLFLLLNAPFLAMIQITVYTGAIMVLFLFVIMLLGAERLQVAEASPYAPKFRWYMPLAIGLVVALLLILGITLGQINFGLSTDTTPQPQVRVLNAAPDAGVVDVYANDQLIVSGVDFSQTSTYVTLGAGDYTLKIQPAVGVPLTTPISLKQGTQQTLVTYGSNRNLSVTLVPDDTSTISEDRSARLTFFNGDSDLAGMRLVDLGSSLDVANANEMIAGLVPGQASDSLIVPEGTVNWAFVDANNPQNVVYRLLNYNVSRDTDTLVVLTEQRVFNGTQGGILRPAAVPVSAVTTPAFGGPQAIGEQLFTNYMLVFQLLAVLLLAAMVGAIVLTQRTVKRPVRRGGRRIVSRPLVSVIAAQVGHDVTSSDESAPELEEPVGK